MSLTRKDAMKELFKQEYAVYERSQHVLKNTTVDTDTLYQEYKSLQENYLNLLNHSAKITRMGDTSQRKLLEANEKIEYQSELINKANQELIYKNEQIIQQQRELRFRNEILERELNLAKTIQQQLIPSENPMKAIHSLYKPMEEVGGDLFDFVKFRDTQRIGIFISDVSGHGVAAAFITAMVKSFIMQSGNRRSNPAKLLLYLNELLVGVTGDNFITAFYGIFNAGNNSIKYANAGHNPPYLIYDNQILLLDGKKGLPLSVMSNVELNLLNKPYVNTELNLQNKGKLVLYTDGLSEAVNIQDTSKEFGSVHLERVFSKSRDLNSQDFVQRVYQELVQFRGSDRFEDDVCLICVDF